jgi:hypothetical protein
MTREAISSSDLCPRSTAQRALIAADIELIWLRGNDLSGLQADGLDERADRLRSAHDSDSLRLAEAPVFAPSARERCRPSASA